MDYMRNNGVYLDKNTLSNLADSIYGRGNDYDPRFIQDYSTLLRGGNIQKGYYDLSNVPITGLGNVNIIDILKRYYGR